MFISHSHIHNQYHKSMHRSLSLSFSQLLVGSTTNPPLGLTPQYNSLPLYGYFKYHNHIGLGLLHIHQVGSYTQILSGRHNTVTAMTARLCTLCMVTIQTIHYQNIPADLCSQPEPAPGSIVVTCISG